MMTHRLKRDEYDCVIPLLEGIEHALIVKAVAEGTAPGEILVDDPNLPRTLFASTPEGYYLLGESRNEAFNEELAELIKAEIVPVGKSDGWAVIYLHYHPNNWKSRLQTSLGQMTPVMDHQRYFQLGEIKVDWRELVPEGFHIQKVDEGFLNQSQLKNAGALKRQAVSNFKSIDGFLEHGFGFCMTNEDEIVCWCMADCVSGHRCEVGIRTVEGYRRRGFATITVAAAMEYCRANGLSQVGWHCWNSNLASAATALKVGFREIRDHHAFIIWLRKIDALLVKGNLALMSNRFSEAGSHFEKAFQLKELPDEESFLLAGAKEEQLYHYHAACAWALAGERQLALANMGTALDIGGFRQGGY
jgi:GNAT superfamily N-acetyltransferase